MERTSKNSRRVGQAFSIDRDVLMLFREVAPPGRMSAIVEGLIRRWTEVQVGRYMEDWEKMSGAADEAVRDVDERGRVTKARVLRKTDIELIRKLLVQLPRIDPERRELDGKEEEDQERQAAHDAADQ